MKKLRKALALVLSLVMLVSVVPFTVNAEDFDVDYSVAKVNGSDYDGTTPIVNGDTVSVDITIHCDEGETLWAWMFGYNYDSEALTYGGTVFGNEWKGSTNDKNGYVVIGGTVKVGTTVQQSEIVVATINFTVDDDFTGTTEILTGLGTRNYLTVSSGTESVHTKSDIAIQGCNLTIYAAVDKTALKTQLELAASLDEDAYTPNSWAGLASALPGAQAVYDNAFATQQEIDDATAAVANAISALVPIGNKYALQNAVNNGKIEAAKGYYTAESVANLNEKIAAAQLVLDDDNATQAEIDAMTATVLQAIDDLVFNNVVVRFLNYDGSVFDEQTVTYGGSATVPENTPTKPADKEYEYTFERWEGQYENVTASVDITPVFSQTKVEYTITFVNEDDSLIVEQTYHYGDEVTAPAAPTKAEDDTYTYEFAGWSPAIEAVSGNATYKATFTPIYKDYTIKFENYDGSEVATYTLHWGDEVTAPAAPSKAEDDTYTYEFAGWSPAVTAVAGDATYTATFTPVYKEYTIQFVDYDGSEIASYTLHWGDEVTAPEAPARDADDTYTYTFLGWTPEVVAVAGDAVYVAQYQETYIDYTVSFVNYDGSEVATYTLHWGDEVTAPAAPSRAEDDTYTYEFAGWTPEIDVVSGNITYTATYTPVYKEYTIQFVNYDGSEVATYTLHWGDEVTAPAAPTKPADDQYSYEFSGWSPEVTAVAGDAVYTAQFTETTKKYTVYFLNYDGTIFAQAEYEYGATPVAPEGTPSKPDDDMYYYSFVDWAPAFAPVTGDTNYTAEFEPYYLDADYTAVNAAIDAAMAYKDAADNYTSVSFARVFAAVDAVEYNLTIDKQAQVDAYATAILAAIDNLVSTTDYDAMYAKSAAVNNDNNQYTVDSYNAFKAAFEAIGAKKDFNTEEATQAQVDAATKELEDAYALLQAATLEIAGAEENLGDSEVRINANTSADTTSLVANDGGAGTAVLVFTDVKGNVITNTKQSFGTGTKVELVQGSDVKLTKYIIVYGDINGDGQVSIADIRLARKMAVSTDGYTQQQIEAAKCGGADVDVDAVIALAKAL